MKRLLLICGLLWAAVASAQFTPGQLLTAQELNNQFALYAPLGGAVFTGPITATATTQGRLDNSTSLATDQFVNQQGASAVATVPFANVTGGIYNQATLGSGCQVVVFASGGVITSSLTIGNPGSGYAVGDLLAVPAGNSDAVLRVTGVSGGGVTSVGIAYGGTGYTTGNVVTTMGVPPGRRAVNFTGTLTSNLTFIIQSGTFLTASREVEFLNNTTGAFTITVKLSNGAGGSTGTGVVLPQGTNNSTALTVYTDGVNDVWLSNVPAAPGTVPLSSLAAQAANTVVANATAGSASPTAVAIPSCSTTTSALNWTSGTGFSCGGTGFAALTGATFTGTVNANARLFVVDSANNTTTLGITNTGSNGANILLTGNGATTPSKSIRVNGGVLQICNSAYSGCPVSINDTGNLTDSGGIDNTAVGANTPSTGSFTTLAASGNFTPSQTAGIVGTTTNNNANAGSVGEFQNSSFSAVNITTTSTLQNLTTLSLTAGDWDVQGFASLISGSGATQTFQVAGISTTSITLPASGNYWQTNITVSATGAQGCAAPIQRISIASTTTVYLVAEAGFSGGSVSASGFLRARRIR
jgi:hypothetical protein